MTKVYIDLEKSMPPEGFEFTGDFRRAEVGEWYLLGPKARHAALASTGGSRPILKKLRWRAAEDETYWYINSAGSPCRDYESRTQLHSDRHHVGNYFETWEQARDFAEATRKFWESFKLDA